LNIEKSTGFIPTKINRINDLAVTQIDATRTSYLSIIALSPNTSFNISRGGGIAKERAIIFQIVSRHKDYTPFHEVLRKVFQLDVNNSNWDSWINEVKGSLRDEIVYKFNNVLNPSNSLYGQLLNTCETGFNINNSPQYRKIIGGLRRILASVCVEYLKPDLIIMDEFQRFKYLIDYEEDSDIKLITESLLTNDTIKILLMSATPYKMYVLQSDEEEGESHFEEFKFIIDFLLKGEEKKKKFSEAWDEYSKSLLHLEERNWDLIKDEKRKVESLLRSVIARTERISVSDDKNTLLRTSPLCTIWIKPSDIKTFIAADSVASKLKDVNSPVEYCKSSPFPFSFMEGYQLQKITQREIANGNAEIIDALSQGKESFLPIDKMNDYQEIEINNAKLSYLLNDALYNGGSDMLWIPPSLPYYKFEGPYNGQEKFSKTLVFSSWIMVPKMIAAMSSYECERLTIGDANAIKNAEERSERKFFHTGSDRHPKARLNLKIDNRTFSSLPNYSLLYPCVALSELWNPLIKYQSLSEVIDDVTLKIQSLLKTIYISEFISERSKREDHRWALIYMLLLDRKYKRDLVSSLQESENLVDWGWFNADDENSVANEYFEKVFLQILFSGTSHNLPAWELAHGARADNSAKQALYSLRLGNPPSDIARQLAYLTISSPAICSYRLLSSFTTNNKLSYISFYGAFRVADSFRKFFNWPENIAVIDKFKVFDSYWKNVLAYSAAGNFQSMLDEFAAAMIDHNGLWDYSTADKVSKLIEVITKNIGLRTVSVAGHTYQSFIKESKPRHFRCHYGVALNQSIIDEKDVIHSDKVRDAFNSPFRPFILSTTSIGQEGLDFHLYCRKIMHWNLPANPIDFEQREGRINRFKNLAIRQNIALKYRDKITNANSSTVWNQLYQITADIEKGDKSDLVPFWHVEPSNIFIERQVPTIPYSKEVRKLKDLLRTISVYRLALGQPRQEELVKYLIENFSQEEIEKVQRELLINLSPYKTNN
jgi:hypothetical protein